MRTGSIYALTEPGTGEVRYIGQTVKPLNERLSQHKHAGTPRVSKWVRQLAERGEQPGIVQLQTNVPANELGTAERKHIRQHASADLLNVIHNPQASIASQVHPGDGSSIETAIPATLIRRTLGSVIDRVRNGEQVFISEHGYPIAVLISIADYRKLTEATR